MLRARGFSRLSSGPVSRAGPAPAWNRDATYAYGPLRGDWSTIVEVGFSPPGHPLVAEIGNVLSSVLQTQVLSLMVHDEDVLLYNLSDRGREIDGYNSDPQYFQAERVAETSVEQQRHTPGAFKPLLPRGVTLWSLEEILQRGWWAAHDAGLLDADGVELDSDAGFLFESERLEAIGNLLRLHGEGTGYPYAGWEDADPATWDGFTQAVYGRTAPPPKQAHRLRR